MSRDGSLAAGFFAVAALPRTGFPFVRAGIVAPVLIVGGSAIVWAGGARRPR